MPLPKSKKTKLRTHRKRRHDFIAAWLRSPLSMGAILPSSRALARAMAIRVDRDRPGIVIELGAGTGVVTHALLQAGIAPKQLLVVEREKKLHAQLAEQYTHLNVVCGDAMHLDQLLQQMDYPRVNVIVSSLPMMTLPKLVKQTIQEQMAMLICTHGASVIQFTYGAKSPLNRNELRKYHITGKRVKTVFTNVPPAHIWVYGRE